MTVVCEDAIVRRRLAEYASERDVLLEAITRMLRQDSRVVAAWLFGSVGRGTADELSDLDVFVIVDDQHLAEAIATRAAMMASVGAPLLVLEAPQNAPPGGAYNMALYDGKEGPHQVDWYWQGRAAAAVPRQTLLLFDHVGLPRIDTPTHFDYQPVPKRDPIEVMAQTVNFFWVMLLIAAKYVARSPTEEGIGLANYCRVTLQEVGEFLGRAPLAASGGSEKEPAGMAASTGAGKVAFLRELRDQMLDLMPTVAAKGMRVPWDVVEPAQRYLALIEAVALRSVQTDLPSTPPIV